MKDEIKKIEQNKIIIDKVLNEKDIEKKIETCRLLNDIGIYCGTDGLVKRLETLKKNKRNEKIDELIRHISGDLEILRIS